MTNRVNHCPNCGKGGMEFTSPEWDQVDVMHDRGLIGFSLSCRDCAFRIPSFMTVGTLHSFLVKFCKERDLYRKELIGKVWTPPTDVTDDSPQLERLKPYLVGLFDHMMCNFWTNSRPIRDKYIADSPALRSLIAAAQKTSVDDFASDYVVVTRDVFNVEYHFVQVHVGQSLAH